MITIFFTGNRLARLVYLSQGQKYNKEYFINEILEGINRGLNGGAGTRTTKTLKTPMDNCPWCSRAIHPPLSTIGQRLFPLFLLEIRDGSSLFRF
jgi:hypothetical protein